MPFEVSFSLDIEEAVISPICKSSITQAKGDFFLCENSVYSFQVLYLAIDTSNALGHPPLMSKIVWC